MRAFITVSFTGKIEPFASRHRNETDAEMREVYDWLEHNAARYAGQSVLLQRLPDGSYFAVGLAETDNWRDLIGGDLADGQVIVVIEDQQPLPQPETE